MVWDKNIYYDKYEHYQKYREEHKKSPQGRKISRISDWKRRGILCFDYDLLYEYFINTQHCEICNIKFGDNPRKGDGRCLDHDHSINDRFNVRYVCCRRCNIKLK